MENFLKFGIVLLTTLGFSNFYFMIMGELNKRRKLTWSDWLDISGHMDLLHQYRKICQREGVFPTWFWVQITIGILLIVDFVCLVRFFG